MAIRDFFKTLEKTKDSEASDAMPSVEGPDLSLRDGQTITVNFGVSK